MPWKVKQTMNRSLRTLNKALAAVFVLLLSLSAFAAAPQINNFGQISDTYYRGAQPEGQDYADLAGFGIHTVINLTNGDGDANEQSMVEKTGMKYFQIPMTTHVNPTESQISEFLKIVNDPAMQPVYVHCVGGKHRTGVMTAIYRMTQNKWTADQAFDEMKKYKFGMEFLHPEFKSFVYDYYGQLKAAPVVTAQQTPVDAAPAATAAP